MMFSFNSNFKDFPLWTNLPGEYGQLSKIKLLKVLARRRTCSTLVIVIDFKKFLDSFINQQSVWNVNQQISHQTTTLLKDSKWPRVSTYSIFDYGVCRITVYTSFGYHTFLRPIHTSHSEPLWFHSEPKKDI